MLCLFDAPLRAATTDPQEVLGEDIGEFLPRGADSARLRRLTSEIEMWLFEHAVNEARRARAAPPISGLWLWGGGAADSSLPPVHGWAVGADPLFAAFAGPRDRSTGALGLRSGGDCANGRARPAGAMRSGTGLRRRPRSCASGRLTRLDLSAGRDASA